MPPDTFQRALLAPLADVPHLTVRPADGPPGSGMQYGLVLTTADGAETWWQIANRAPTGPPTSGPAPAALDVPELPGSGPVEVADLEAALAAAVTRMGGRHEVATVDRYSTRETPPAIRYGLAVQLHDTSALYVQLHWTLKPGQPLTRGTRHRIRITV